MEDVEVDLKDRLDTIEALLSQINARFAELESRNAGIDLHIASVEKVQKVVLTEVRGLATRLDRFTRIRRGQLLPGP